MTAKHLNPDRSAQRIDQRYRILSLDGGGIRGVVTAVWLARLEELVGAPLHRCFDLIAGTSTGSILGCGIAKGVPAREIVELYVERGGEVFPGRARRLWGRFGRVWEEGLSMPRYEDDGLAKVLKAVFGRTTFGALKVRPVLVTTYDTLNRQARVLKNTRARYRALPVWEVCKASASAPTYFPAHVMRLGRARVPLIDGGVVANNPAACALAEAMRIQRERPAGRRVPVERFVLASFGTGQSTRPIDEESARTWGAVEWAMGGAIIDVLFDGACDAVDYIVRHMLPEDGHFRFQTRLDEAFDDMDDASRTNVNALVAAAERHLTEEGGEARLQALAERIAP